MSLSVLIEPYYERHPGKFKSDLRVGQLCHLVVPIPSEVPWILDAERAAPEEHMAIQFKVRHMNDGDFSAHKKLPLKMLSLKSTEEAVVYKAKKRFGVIVALEKTRAPEVAAALGARKHLHDDSLWVVPIYGAETETHEGGIPQILMARVSCLAYRQMFPIFESGEVGVKQGVARLDRIQIALPKGRFFEPLEWCLAPTAMAAMHAMLREVFGSGQETELRDLRGLLADAFS